METGSNKKINWKTVKACCRDPILNKSIIRLRLIINIDRSDQLCLPALCLVTYLLIITVIRAGDFLHSDRMSVFGNS